MKDKSSPKNTDHISHAGRLVVLGDNRLLVRKSWYAYGYEDYHLEFFSGEETPVGSASWDKNQQDGRGWEESRDHYMKTLHTSSEG